MKIKRHGVEKCAVAVIVVIVVVDIVVIVVVDIVVIVVVDIVVIVVFNVAHMRLMSNNTEEISTCQNALQMELK